ncbi:Flp pilus assembly protein CpaB [Massilia sp. CF038]|uniref:Flp pilus assembly protein CpaB n=1 Tax=Massilia sp. CF038 TaxID=1881045 RepID=UPI000922858D|nr:Flp pilus assembly protein CpaB [Massilia sp. CF038]SHH24861.1 pilus assembly protein CpaB [Massilia sp. CF038]
MKISKNTLLLVGAVGLGVLCFVGANYYLRTTLSRAEAKLAGEYKTRKIMVAKAEIPAGGMLTADNLAVRSVPERYLGSTVLEPDAFDMVVGQKLMVPLKPGDPIDRAALERGDHAALSTTVAAGERAITFPVDEISSISGMLVPGDVIDLLYTGPGTTANSYRAAQAGAAPADMLHVRLIMQAVSVMATGKTTQKRVIATEGGGKKEYDAEFSTITLNVGPRQAEQILLAQKLGSLTAVLRNPDDKKMLDRVVLDEAAFKQVESAPRQAGQGRFIETIIGGTGAAGGARIKTPEAESMAAVLKEILPRPAATPAPPAPSAQDVKSRLGIPSGATPTRTSPVSPTKP